MPVIRVLPHPRWVASRYDRESLSQAGGRIADGVDPGIPQPNRSTRTSIRSRPPTATYRCTTAMNGPSAGGAPAAEEAAMHEVSEPQHGAALAGDCDPG
jgi:hypothetical protein